MWVADTVIVVEPDWNVAAEGQAIDRAHRIGQSRAVTVYKLVAADTLEEQILRSYHHHSITASHTNTPSTNPRIRTSRQHPIPPYHPPYPTHLSNSVLLFVRVTELKILSRWLQLHLLLLPVLASALMPHPRFSPGFPLLPATTSVAIAAFW